MSLPSQPNQVVEFLTRTQTATLLGGIVFPHVYGQFSSSQTQSIAQAPNRTSLTYDTTDLAGGGLILQGSGVPPTPNILISTSGVYRVITSVQVNKVAGGSTTEECFIWFAIDGNPVPNSATKTEVANSTEVLMTVEILLSLQAGQSVSVQANANGTRIQAVAYPFNTPQPAIPSIITVVQRIA
jgi:hypothetical protein